MPDTGQPEHRHAERSRRRRAMIGLIAAIGVVAVGVLGIFGLSPRREVDQTLSVSVGMINEITVTMRTENILVRRSDANSAVTITLRGWSRRDVALSGEQSGGSYVVGPLPDPFFPPRLPEDLSVEIVIPQDFPGTLSLHNSSGTVELNGIDAGTVDILTSSGAIAITDVHATTTRIETASGAVNVTDSNGNLSVATSSGAVCVRLPTDAQFALDADTTSGSLTSSFPVETTRTTMTASIGTANNTISLRTSSGRITVESSD